MSSTASVTELATPLQIQQMKHILLLSSSLILTLATSAQEPTNTFDPLGKNLNLPRMIRVMVEFIELPLPELSRLLAEPQTSANDNDLRIATGALIEAGTAKQVETQLIIAVPAKLALSKASPNSPIPQNMNQQAVSHQQ